MPARHSSIAESIVATVSEPLVVLDGGFRVLQANPSFYRTFAVSATGTVGVNLYKLGHGQWDIPALRRLLEQVLPQSSCFEDFEVEHDFPHVGRRVMLLNGRQLLRAEGRTPLILLAIRDVTHERALAHALEERERSLATLLANLPGVAYRCLADARWTLEFLSEGSQALLGYGPADLLADQRGSKVDLICAEDRGQVCAEVQAALERRGPFEMVYRVRTAAGEQKWVSERGGGIYGRDGRLQCLEGFITDVTAQKQAEARLQTYSESLERSNRELQEFAQIASHDLQEPLRKIQAFGDLLRNECGEALTSDGQRYLASILNAAGRMRSLVNALLALARVATRGKPFVPVDLDVLVREVLGDLETRIADTHAAVEVGKLPMVMGDAAQLRQVFQNLIANALKFHREGVIPVVQVCSEQPPAGTNMGATVTVTDNGIGFAEKYLDRIFLPFERLHSRQQYDGTGMGLTICRRILERHGGSITAASSCGTGTTFLLTLPPVEKTA